MSENKIKGKFIVGSTIATISAQWSSEDLIDSVSVYYKKTDDEEFTKWEGTQSVPTYDNPYTTSWEFIGNHYQLSIDTLEPSTSYDMYIKVSNDITDTITFTTDTLNDKWEGVVCGTSTYNTYITQAWDDFTTILRTTGFHPLLKPMKMNYSSVQMTAACSFQGPLTWGGNVKDCVNEDISMHQTTLHELRHYAGIAGGNGFESNTNLMTLNNAVVYDNNLIINTVSAYTNSRYIYVMPQQGCTGETIIADKIYQFQKGTPYAYIRCFKNHSNCIDMRNGNPTPDITDFFLLKSLLFQKVQYYEVNEHQ